jgi:hypothetical protein
MSWSTLEGSELRALLEDDVGCGVLGGGVLGGGVLGGLEGGGVDCGGPAQPQQSAPHMCKT